MIKVENLTRNYGDFKAVDDVSFDISQGEIVGLLGHNGAGKTTIMKMLTGFLEPTGGTITIDGKDIAKHRQQVQDGIGYLPENCPVYPEMTVVDYLDYSAALRGLGETKRAPLVAEAIISTALTEKATEKISALSRGYRQRTGVAQAILHKPQILILDEPTNGLDPTQIQQMRELVTDLAKHATVIISTHILQEVQAICDRVIIVKGGVIALDAKLDSLQADNRLLVQTSAAPDQAVSVLQRCDGVQSVVESTGKNDTDYVYSLNLDESMDRKKNAASIASTVHEQDWQLFAMHFETRDLESVFAEMSGQ